MKTNTTLLIFYAFFISANLSAQVENYLEGTRTIAININPIFPYIGNLMSSDFNNLNLNSAGLVYRNFKSDNIAQRISFTGSFNRYITSYLLSNNLPSNHSRTSMNYNACV